MRYKSWKYMFALMIIEKCSRLRGIASEREKEWMRANLKWRKYSSCATEHDRYRFILRALSIEKSLSLLPPPSSSSPSSLLFIKIIHVLVGMLMIDFFEICRLHFVSCSSKRSIRLHGIAFIYIYLHYNEVTIWSWTNSENAQNVNIEIIVNNNIIVQHVFEFISTHRENYLTDNWQFFIDPVYT